MLTIALFTLVILCGAVGLKSVLIQLNRREDARFFWLISTFGPVLERAQSDPRVLLTWHPLAEISRKRFPDAFSLLDNGKHHHFPFSLPTWNKPMRGGPPHGLRGSANTTQSFANEAGKWKPSSRAMSKLLLAVDGRNLNTWSERNWSVISGIMKIMCKSPRLFRH